MCMSSVLKREQSVHVLQLSQTRAEQDAAQAHRCIEVRHTACCMRAVHSEHLWHEFARVRVRRHGGRCLSPLTAPLAKPGAHGTGDLRPRR